MNEISEKCIEEAERLIRLALEKGATAKELQQATGLSPSGLRSIVIGRTWKNV